MHFAEMHTKPNMYSSFWICVVKHGLQVGIHGVKKEDIAKNGGDLDILDIIARVHSWLHASGRKFRKSFVVKESKMLKFSDAFVSMVAQSLAEKEGLVERIRDWLGMSDVNERKKE